MIAKDGPAEGVSLSLRRCPKLLRLVRDETMGAWDALDQLDDTPSPDESVHVYRRVEGTWSVVFACGRGRGGGRFELAEYRHVADVDGESVRSMEAWREWCLGQPEARPKAEAA